MSANWAKCWCNCWQWATCFTWMSKCVFMFTSGDTENIQTRSGKVKSVVHVGIGSWPFICYAAILELRSHNTTNIIVLLPRLPHVHNVLVKTYFLLHKISFSMAFPEHASVMIIILAKQCSIHSTSSLKKHIEYTTFPEHIQAKHERRMFTRVYNNEIIV